MHTEQILETLKQFPHNIHYLNRYIKFVMSQPVIPRGKYGEKHHIIPVSYHPEFKLIGVAPWNQKRISARVHYICHWMLTKAFPQDPKMKHAFWGMCNQKKEGRNYKVNSSAYAYAKAEWSKFVVERNKTWTGENSPSYGKSRSGWNHTAESIKKMSVAQKGLVTAYDKNGVGVKITQEEFQTGNYVSRFAGNVTVRHKETGESKRMSVDEVANNPDYEYATCGKHNWTDEGKENLRKASTGKYVCFDTLENKTVKIDLDVYHANKDRYKTVVYADTKQKQSEVKKGKVGCFDSLLRIQTMVSKEEFDSDKKRYFSFRSKAYAKWKAENL